MDTPEKQLREQTRQAIMDVIDSGEATEQQMLKAYLAHYTKPFHRNTKHDRLAAFMQRMERDGLVACTYDANGHIIAAKSSV